MGRGKVDRGRLWPQGFSVKPFLLPIYLYSGWFLANELLILSGFEPSRVRPGGCDALALLLGWAALLSGPSLYYFQILRPDKLQWKRTHRLMVLSILALHCRAMLAERIQISGHSMEPYLSEGSAFWIVKGKAPELDFPFSFDTSFRWKMTSGLDRGVVVAFHYPETGCRRTIWIKRVIAVAGDTYRWSDGVFYVNGKPESQHWKNAPKTTPLHAQEYQPPIFQPPATVQALGTEAIYAAMNGIGTAGTVPDGAILVMGDNRSQSRDSRAIGFVPVVWVIGSYWFKE
ncbi:MAG: signal peptidase I [Leptospiraceae bacterium]|nr:signal peptidase I [Leptospiraceae bacterium]